MVRADARTEPRVRELRLRRLQGLASDATLGASAIPDAVLYAIDRTTPPSARTAAPLMLEASGLHTKAMTAAISSGASNRLSSDVGLARSKKSRSNEASSTPCAAA